MDPLINISYASRPPKGLSDKMFTGKLSFYLRISSLKRDSLDGHYTNKIIGERLISIILPTKPVPWRILTVQVEKILPKKILSKINYKDYEINP